MSKCLKTGHSATRVFIVNPWTQLVHDIKMYHFTWRASAANSKQSPAVRGTGSPQASQCSTGSRHGRSSSTTHRSDCQCQTPWTRQTQRTLSYEYISGSAELSYY